TVVHHARHGNWRRRLEFDGSNNRLSTSATSGEPAARYGYDAHGNTTRMPHVAKLAWDLKDRVRRVERHGGGRVYSVSETDGGRVRKVVVRPNGTRQRERLYLGGLEIHREFAGDGGTVTLGRQTGRSGPGHPAR